MQKAIRQLAGETALYGMSTILARIVNFMLVPLYTRVLTQSDYGSLTEFMAYIAILQVVLTLGLETGCFRFANKEGVNSNAVFSNAFSMVLGICLVFFFTIVLFSNNISERLGYQGFQNVIINVGAILLIDNSTAIIFAKLRYQHKALKFSIIKSLKILGEVGMNLILYLVMPIRFAANPNHWLLTFVSASPDFSYAIFSILFSCILCAILLLPEICSEKIIFDSKLSKGLLLYSLPLMIAGLPGVLNDFLDRVLMRFLNADPTMWRADLGVYQAGVKIATIMSLFIQMFRYASEPFFFQRQKEMGSRDLYADVMKYFVAFCMFAFLFVMLFIDEIGLILGRDFREGLSIAPIMLMAYVILGMLFNVNMWFKLSGKTGYAIWITLAGLLVTIFINSFFMPKFSYHAAAWGHFASYSVMLIISVTLGNKHYRIPYQWGRIAVLIAVGIGIWKFSSVLPEVSTPIEIFIHLLLLMAYAAIVALICFHRKQAVK